MLVRKVYMCIYINDVYIISLFFETFSFISTVFS